MQSFDICRCFSLHGHRRQNAADKGKGKSKTKSKLIKKPYLRYLFIFVLNFQVERAAAAAEMTVKIRLARLGCKHRPFYRLVAADDKSRRDGKQIEVLGFFDPLQGSSLLLYFPHFSVNSIILDVSAHMNLHLYLPRERRWEKSEPQIRQDQVWLFPPSTLFFFLVLSSSHSHFRV